MCLETYQVELASEIRCTAIRSLITVCLVVLKERPLMLESVRNRLLILDIPLPSVDYRDVTQSQRNDAPSQDVDDIGSFVHQIHLCEHTDCPLTLGINLSRQLQTVGVGQIGVRSCDSQDDGVGLGDVLEHHVADLPLDVAGLVADGDLRQTGEVDERSEACPEEGMRDVTE